MRAIVLEHAGPPEVLEIRSEPRPGWVLIQVKAFGLNHSELFTRQCYSSGVAFPRVLGIECVGWKALRAYASHSSLEQNCAVRATEKE